MTGLTIEQQRRLLDDIYRNGGDIVARQQRGWASDFQRIARAVAQEGEGSAHLPVFWIRLHGVVTELLEQFSSYARTATEIVGQGHLGWVRDAAMVVRTHNACLAVRNALDEDELIYADYRRQVEVHVLQSGYRIHGRMKNGVTVGVKNTYRVTALGKAFAVDELDQRIVRILSQYGSEPPIAVALARKVLAPADALAEAIRASNGG